MVQALGRFRGDVGRAFVLNRYALPLVEGEREKYDRVVGRLDGYLRLARPDAVGEAAQMCLAEGYESQGDGFRTVVKGVDGRYLLNPALGASLRYREECARLASPYANPQGYRDYYRDVFEGYGTGAVEFVDLSDYKVASRIASYGRMGEWLDRRLYTEDQRRLLEEIGISDKNGGFRKKVGALSEDFALAGFSVCPGKDRRNYVVISDDATPPNLSSFGLLSIG